MAKTSHFQFWGLSASLTTVDDDGHDDAVTYLHDTVSAMTAAASRFDPASEINAVNASPTPVALSPLLGDVYRWARYAYLITDGACDPTVLDSLERAGYRDDFDHLPLFGDVEAGAAPSPGLSRVSFDEETNTLTKPTGLTLDFGATAKALTCDIIARHVGATTGVLVEIGGDISAGGEPPVAGWVIGVAETTSIRGDEPTITFAHGGVATSSRRVRRWNTTVGTAHHIIDPRTGLPSASDVATVSVSAVDCVTANAFATACVAWGEDVSYAIAQAGWSARIVKEDGETMFVGGWPEDNR